MDELTRNIMANAPSESTNVPYAQWSDERKRQATAGALRNEASGAYGSAGATPRVNMQKEVTDDFYETAPGKYIDEQIGSEVKHFLGDYSDLPEGMKIGAMPSPGKLLTSGAAKLFQPALPYAARAATKQGVKKASQGFHNPMGHLTPKSYNPPKTPFLSNMGTPEKVALAAAAAGGTGLAIKSGVDWTKRKIAELNAEVAGASESQNNNGWN